MASLCDCRGSLTPSEYGRITARVASGSFTLANVSHCRQVGWMANTGLAQARLKLADSVVRTYRIPCHVAVHDLSPSVGLHPLK